MIDSRTFNRRGSNLNSDISHRALLSSKSRRPIYFSRGHYFKTCHLRVRVRNQVTVSSTSWPSSIEESHASENIASTSSPAFKFSWLSHWYPLQVLDSTDASRPHAVEVLGKHLVLWRDNNKNWCCMEDACPHRLAPLSEGRVESDGTLQCSYHGWRFTSQGKCTEIPQSIDEKAKTVACSSSRSCALTYPVREDCGLIWVWPDSRPEAASLAARTPTPVSQGVVQRWNDPTKTKPSWYRRELSYSFDVLIENLADPSHLPFSHHKLTPALTRSKGVAMPFKEVVHVNASVTAPASEQISHQLPQYSFAHQAPLATFQFPSALSPSGYVSFTAPNTVVYQYDMGSTGQYTGTHLIAVPVGPGRSVAYTLSFYTLPEAKLGDVVQSLFSDRKKIIPLVYRLIFQSRPAYSSHLAMNKLFDQDGAFLNMQDRALGQRGRSSWMKEYYMPAASDGLVAVARRWMDHALQLPLRGSWDASLDPSTSLHNANHEGKGGIMTSQALSNGRSNTINSRLELETGVINSSDVSAASVITMSAEAASSPRQPKRQLQDRFSQHTQHCTVCLAALKSLEGRLTFARVAAAVQACMLLCLVPLLFVWYKVVAAGAAANSGPVALLSSGIGKLSLLGAFTTHPLSILCISVGFMLAMYVAFSTERQMKEFEYMDFSHADNH
ncbi:hypothetical protein CEUSTIGMA_g6579.t1 [Chlamydomonas eustigma]|uniref:Rieske domain-containing protein n=1 Tax=Chlamydomonas eustigma TaxID=1157962 RepID=A0A250X887_9CHLO|nr:hypothetical protein CEUSTIGMA_g6579.t1 [Chlamydomonas eustigma]|eukprot:GAX79139.1 hypothetical protein CEUSTIGMA_g6579.t1 [Chlamydomonas eustigma]